MKTILAIITLSFFANLAVRTYHNWQFKRSSDKRFKIVLQSILAVKGKEEEKEKIRRSLSLVIPKTAGQLELERQEAISKPIAIPND